MNFKSLYKPFFRYFRTRRMINFRKTFGINSTTRVLDVGGSEYNWGLLGVKPRVTLLNIYLDRQNKSPWLVGDGCALPFVDQAFDIVYSNSVIEHLYTWERQRDFANECQRVGTYYYVQTPNKWFPIEPHLLTPFIHWLPQRLQMRLLRNWTLWGLMYRPTPQRCEEQVREVRLLDEEDLRRLFSDAEIVRERVLHFTKSLIAQRCVTKRH